MKTAALIDSVILSQDHILRNLSTCEKTIGELYALYGQCYPEMLSFWEELAREEQAHGAIIDRVRFDLAEGTLMRGLDHFGAETVQVRIDFVRSKIAEAKKQPPKKEEAIATAYSIESSIIDSRFFEFAESNGTQFQKAAYQLAHDTKAHMKLVNDARDAVGKCAQNALKETQYSADHSFIMSRESDDEFLFLSPLD